MWAPQACKCFTDGPALAPSSTPPHSTPFSCLQQPRAPDARAGRSQQHCGSGGAPPAAALRRAGGCDGHLWRLCGRWVWGLHMGSWADGCFLAVTAQQLWQGRLEATWQAAQAMVPGFRFMAVQLTARGLGCNSRKGISASCAHSEPQPSHAVFAEPPIRGRVRVQSHTVFLLNAFPCVLCSCRHGRGARVQ